MKRWFCLCLFFLLQVGYFQSGICQTLTILSNPTTTINTTNGYTNGVTINNQTVQVSVKRNQTWSLSVRASSNLTSGLNSVPVGQVRMQATNTILTTRPLVTLSTTTQTLATDQATNNPERTVPLNIIYTISGGSNLLRPSGNYATTLTFTLTVL